MTYTITLVGGGNSTHCLAPLISSLPGYSCRILTRSPAAFAPTLQLENADAGWDVPELLEGTPSLITSDPSLAIPGADMVLLAGLPVHLNRALLLSILPHLPADGRLVLVGSVCCYGHFSALLSSLLPPGANASPFGTALIPFCCSTPAYGRRGRVIGAKRLLRVATPGGRDPHGVKKILGPVLRTRLEDVSFLASTLWPNNASLHPPILYGLFSGWDGSSRFPRADLPTFIYKEMTRESGERVEEFDRELQSLVAALAARFPSHAALKHDFSMKACVLENYAEQVSDPSTTHSCIATNKAFSEHKLLFDEEDGRGEVAPVLKHKFFEMDLPFGLIPFKDLGVMLQLKTPLLDAICLWNQRLIGKEFIREIRRDGLEVEWGRDVAECVVPSLMGLGLEDLDE